MSSRGFSNGKLDRLEREVQKRMDNKVPFDLWTHEQQMYHAYYVTGQKCPSSAPLGSLQVREQVAVLREGKD